MKQFSFIRLAALLLSVVFFLSSCGTSRSDSSKGSTTATISAVGDIFLSPEMLTEARTSSGMPDFMPLFAPIVTQIAKADLTIGNFEGTFADSDENSYPDALAATLAKCGFDILQTANSYSVFHGLSGLVRTKDVIEAQDMHAIGTYRSPEEREKEMILIQEVNGIRFAFIALTKGFNGMGLPADSEYSVNLLYKDYATDYEKVDREGIRSLVAAASEQNPDFIIASLHWGSEDISGISKTQEEITDILLNEGVDVIFGSHSHRLEQIEGKTIQKENQPDRECVVAYGLGDFCATKSGKSNTAIILNMEFTKDLDTGEHSISKVDYVPVSTIDNGEDHSPRYTVEATKDAIRLYEDNYYLRVGEEAYAAMVEDLEGLEETIFPTTEPETTETTSE